MATEEIPEWAQTLLEAIGATIEFKSSADMEGRYFAPDETSWGIHLLELAPAVMDMSKYESEDDEEEGYGVIHNLDLLEAPKALDEVKSLSFGVDDAGTPRIMIEGKSGEHDLAVLIYAEPFYDADADPDED